MKPTFPLDPSLDFLEKLWRLNHALARVSQRMEQRHGITAQQRLVLRCVATFPAITAGELARVLHLDAGTISATLNRLTDRRLLRRGRDKADLRRVTLSLTARGRQLAARLEPSVERAVEALLASTPTRDLAASRRTLDALTELLLRQARVS